MSRRFTLAAASLITLAVLACGDTTAPAAPAPAITLTAAQTNLISFGETSQLLAKDESGAVVDKPVTWTSSTPAVATVSAAGVVTAVANGSATITAKVDSLTATTTITVTQVAAKLAFVGKPGTTQFGVTLPALVVQIQDANGNLVSDATNAITVAIEANPANGALAGSTQVTAANGVASFNTLAIDKAAVGYTLSATAAGLSAATSSAFEIMDVAIRIDSVKLASSSVKIGASTAYSIWITNGSGRNLTSVLIQGYILQNNTVNGAGGLAALGCGSATSGTIVPGTCKMDWALYASNGTYTAGAATAKIDLQEGSTPRGSKTLPVTMTP
jgi:hypothetical protein